MKDWIFTIIALAIRAWIGGGIGAMVATGIASGLDISLENGMTEIIMVIGATIGIIIYFIYTYYEVKSQL